MDINRPETRQERHARFERYRKLADEAEASAAESNAADVRERLMEIAKVWRHLAEQIKQE